MATEGIYDAEIYHHHSAGPGGVGAACCGPGVTGGGRCTLASPPESSSGSSGSSPCAPPPHAGDEGLQMTPPPPSGPSGALSPPPLGGGGGDSLIDHFMPPPGRVGVHSFRIVRVLGKGSYGKVMLVEMKGTPYLYAMKMLRKDSIVKRKQIEHTLTERNVLARFAIKQHPFIVRLYYAFQTPQKLFFITEYCAGGELFFHLSRVGRFSEYRTRFYAAQILLAIKHLHQAAVVYRDLKPENVLLDSEGHIRLTDFGLSKENISDNYSAKSLCGTPEYLAPEILHQTGHGRAIDWWSFGAIVYEMLTGLPPFYTRDREKLFDSIKHAPLPLPSFLSVAARDLLAGLFRRDPNRRLGGGPADAEEIMAHPFFMGVDFNAMLRKEIPSPFLPTLTSRYDTSYFDAEFVNMPISVEHDGCGDSCEGVTCGEGGGISSAQDRLFEGFSFEAY